MRILHVNDYSWSGGCEVLLNDTVARLNARGLATELFTADLVPGHRRTPLGYIDSRRCRRALAERLAAFDPDVVHVHNFYHELSPGILAALRRWRDGAAALRPRRVVMTAHDHHLICPNSGLLSFRAGRLTAADPLRLGSVWYLVRHDWDHRGREYSLLKLAQHLWNYRLHHRRGVLDLVICPSRYMQRMLSAYGLTTAVVPNPLPATGERREKAGGPLRLVFAGRIEPEKGLERFLQMLPAEREGVFEVIGEGSSVAACRQICRRRALRMEVRFCGRLPRPETLGRIAEAHVLVLPSVCPENGPMSLLEALAVGTNVLTTDLGGAGEIVRDSGVGFLIRPDDAESLEAALQGIDQAFADGSLNGFDVSAYLAGRNEEVYIEQLMELYTTELPESYGEGI